MSLTARDISKERHTKQLIAAAKQAIHKYGVRGATIGRIQELSGLSRGMINTRFDSKENLLEQAVKELSAEYTVLWQRALEQAAPDPLSQLRALVLSDFSVEVLNEPNITLWFAFRSEAKSRAAYLPYISTREEPLTGMFNRICADLAKHEGVSEKDGTMAAALLMATLEGLWADYHLHPDEFDRQEAIALVWHLVQQLFPNTVSGAE
ncbi:TetR family transcriptional regulator C-terminal domain-containing protein [Lentibacter algarum]|uniref:TetR family transcriptional regulator C-terminal domain-containing protein n=1 Tax=Lentibacter algarum TaxID=576131 RepID=UPI001C06C8B1|nr:TetR family transcriptional regulator C-terminal domain-containing protein [Lentibacter algarum]MBU2980210.1 TetR family transcriptional regulator C-terminal domain-containing protein [Lentibacter algarum]